MLRAKLLRDETGYSRPKIAYVLAQRGVRVDQGQLREWELGMKGLGDDKKLALRDLYSLLLGRRVTLDEMLEEAGVGVGKKKSKAELEIIRVV